MRPLLLAMLCLCGCTTLRPVEPGAVSAVLAELQVGDRISVRTAEGWHEGLKVTALTETEIEADVGFAPVTIRRDDVSEMKVRRDSPGKTAGLASGIVIGATLGLFLLSGYELD